MEGIKFDFCTVILQVSVKECAHTNSTGASNKYHRTESKNESVSDEA